MFRISEMKEMERPYTPPETESYAFDVRVETDARMVSDISWCPENCPTPLPQENYPSLVVKLF